MQYQGLRFRVQAGLVGKVYGGPFGVDAAFAEPLVGEPELLRGSDFLAFAGVEPPTVQVFPLEIPWTELATVVEPTRAFLDPALAGP